jgi:phosphatidylserine/phosphatidylglycerophosphate/cardiolipin synthase-like enzyme
MDAQTSSKQSGGLRVVAYGGDTKILLAMSLDDAQIGPGAKNLAGFAIWRKLAGKPEENLPNRIGFDSGVSQDTTSETREWTDSDKAPFQKFRWVDVPAEGFTAAITYRVKALYFTGQGHATKDGPEVTIEVQPAEVRHTRFQPGFTRGFIASQAYADKFKGADIRPKGKKTADFDTSPFEQQYEWLGADARVKLREFIDDCKQDQTALVNVFAYDIDEPEFIADICQFGKEGRLRAILDNASLHTKAGAVEIEVAKMVKASAGAENVKQGKFDRFQHNKVFIKRDASGKAKRVLFGSMNFSVRGLYVQANNVIVVDDENVAGMFATAFDVAFADDVKAPLFRQNPISQSYMIGSAEDTAELPKFSVSLSPHTDWSVSLGPMADRIRKSTSSVLFAVMAPSGGGPVLASLREIAKNPTVFSYGTVETDHGIIVQSPNGAMGDLTGFAFLSKNVPPPFKKEFGGGTGMHIHDKFVVVDFNGDNPTVFTGSSNLASGGETQNGDSLVMIEDEAIATMFAIEAVAMFDHFHFRKAMQAATKPQPLTLWFPGKPGAPDPWWKAYYDPTRIQMRDRLLFADLPLPAGLEAIKTVDWEAVDKEAATAGKKTGGKAKAGKTKTSKTKTSRAKTGKTKAGKTKGAAKTTHAPVPHKKAAAKSKSSTKRSGPKKKTKAKPKKARAAHAKTAAKKSKPKKTAHKRKTALRR